MKHTNRLAVVFVVICCEVGVMAQVGGSGTTNSVARWTNNTTLGNSNIFLSNGSSCAGGVGGWLPRIQVQAKRKALG